MHDTEPKHNDATENPGDTTPSGGADDVAALMAEAVASVDAARAEAAMGEEVELLDDDLVETTEGPEAALAAEVASLEQRLAEARAESDSMRDQWLRARADFENHKKRTKRDMEDAKQRDAMKLLSDFFPVLDNLDRALSTVQDDAGGQLVDGIMLVRREFLGALRKHDIVPVDAVGKPFDPAYHEALQQLDSADHAPGTVMVEFEKGFMRGDRLLRPSRVVVASANSTGVAPEPEAPDSPDGSGEPTASGEDQP